MLASGVSSDAQDAHRLTCDGSTAEQPPAVRMNAEQLERIAEAMRRHAWAQMTRR
jgi:hypothetical protein